MENGSFSICQMQLSASKHISMKRFFLVSILLFVVFVGVDAQCEGIPSTADHLVNDGARMLSQREQQTLEGKLVNYDQETSTQIAIVTESSLQGGDDFERALCYFETWGIGGSREQSNGVLIYVAVEDRKIRIMTGYGVEGFLPDAIAKRIIDNIITPAFRQGRYYEGFDRATDAIIDYGQGEYTNEKGSSSGDSNFFAMLIIIAFLVVIIIILGIIGRNDHDDGDDGGYWRGGRYDDPDRRYHSGRRSRGGGWIIFPGGGGWSSGGGGGGFGGGFGGFGGGLTGGGGAGGSW